MSGVKQRKVSIEVTTRSVTAASVSVKEKKVTDGSVGETKTASISGVTPIADGNPSRQGAAASVKRIGDKKTLRYANATAKPDGNGAPAGKQDSRKGISGKAAKGAADSKAPEAASKAEYGSTRAKMLGLAEKAATVKALADALEGESDDQGADELAVAHNQAQAAARTYRKRAAEKKAAEGDIRGGKPEARARQATAGKGSARQDATRRAAEESTAGQTAAAGRSPRPPAHPSPPSKTGAATGTKAGQAAAKGTLGPRAAASQAASAQQARMHMQAAIVKQASEKTGGGTLLAVIASTLGMPVGAVVALIVAVIVGVVLVVAIVASIVGMAQEDLNIEGLNDVEAAVATRLREMGWDNVHIAAAMGNIYCESGFTLDSVELGHTIGSLQDATAQRIGVGLMGWTTADSHVKLEKIASEKGLPWTSIDVQLDMMEYWMNSVFVGSSSYMITDSRSTDPPAGTHVGGSRAAFDKSNDVEECTLHYCYVAERPGIPHQTRRIEKAKEYLGILNSPSNRGGSISLDGAELGDPLTGTGWVKSSGFGYRSFGGGEYHKGLDMAAPMGTPYYAAESGTVLYATNGGGYNGGAGNWVVIDHGNGLVTKYMHSSATFVKPGDKVEKGDHIGNVGSTGASTGPHLHFQVEKNGVAVDPEPLIGR